MVSRSTDPHKQKIAHQTIKQSEAEWVSWRICLGAARTNIARGRFFFEKSKTAPCILSQPFAGRYQSRLPANHDNRMGYPKAKERNKLKVNEKSAKNRSVEVVFRTATTGNMRHGEAEDLEHTME